MIQNINSNAPTFIIVISAGVWGLKLIVVRMKSWIIKIRGQAWAYLRKTIKNLGENSRSVGIHKQERCSRTRPHGQPTAAKRRACFP
jgi:hypothetical protein